MANSKSNPDVDRLSDLIYAMVKRAIDEKVGKFFTDQGQLNLRGTPVRGPLGTTGGGTGTTTGLRDHSHSGASGEAQQLVEANTHQALDVNPTTRKHWTREDIQDMIAGGFLVAGSGITLVYDDAGNTLTINAPSGGEGLYWDGSPLTFDSDGLYWA